MSVQSEQCHFTDLSVSDQFFQGNLLFAVLPETVVTLEAEWRLAHTHTHMDTHTWTHTHGHTHMDTHTWTHTHTKKN